MTESTTPVVVAEEHLPEGVKELTKEQRLSRARNAATSMLLDKYRNEFNATMQREAASLGIDWTPRKSEEEKALEEIEALLAKHSGLRDTLVAKLEIHPTDGDPDRTEDLSGDPVTPDPEEGTKGGGAAPAESDLSKPAVAWVAGARREGRVTLDGEVFVYSVAGGETRRVSVDGDTVKLIED